MTVMEWLDGEREYAEAKWSPAETQRFVAVGGVGIGSPSMEWVKQYMHRAQVLGLGTPRGRQALAKSLRTLLAITEAAVELYGPLPAPGVNSGEIVEEAA